MIFLAGTAGNFQGKERDGGSNGNDISEAAANSSGVVKTCPAPGFARGRESLQSYQPATQTVESQMDYNAIQTPSGILRFQRHLAASKEIK